MHDEAGFLATIRQTPADDTARLVFADWLDEQDDPACKTKAQFIRFELQMAETPEGNRHTEDYRPVQLQQLAARIDPAWLVVVSHPKLEACRSLRDRSCPSNWSELSPTTTPTIRSCKSCRKPVHYCETLHDAQIYANRGGCVVLSLALVRRLGDMYTPTSPALERVAPDELERRERASRLAAKLGASYPEVVLIETIWGGRRQAPVPKPLRERGRAEHTRRRTSKARRQRDNSEDAE